MRCFLLNKYVNNVKKILQHLRQRSGLFFQLFSVGIIPMGRTRRKGFRIRKSSFVTKSVRPENQLLQSFQPFPFDFICSDPFFGP